MNSLEYKSDIVVANSALFLDLHHDGSIVTSRNVESPHCIVVEEIYLVVIAVLEDLKVYAFLKKDSICICLRFTLEIDLTLLAIDKHETLEADSRTCRDINPVDKSRVSISLIDSGYWLSDL